MTIAGTDPNGREGIQVPGISSRDAKILKAVQNRAHYLDKSFSSCGLRFGWTAIIGIVPGAGDVACAALNYVLVVRKARQADLPSWLTSKMQLNNAVSVIGGTVGDVVVNFLRIGGEEYLMLQAGTMAELPRVAFRKGTWSRSSREQAWNLHVIHVAEGEEADDGT